MGHEDVPQQLQVVGELCKEQGKAMVSAMGATILYTVNPKRPRTGSYDLKILTVVTDASDGLQAVQEGMKCSIGERESMKKGVAGHVTMTYPSGGQLVTSMGHCSLASTPRSSQSCAPQGTTLVPQRPMT